MKINAICKTPDPEGRRKVLQSIYDNFKSSRDTAKHLKVDLGTFSRWCTRYGVKVNKCGRKKTPKSTRWQFRAELHGFDTVKGLLKYFHKHHNMIHASRTLGVSWVTYKSALKKHGIIKEARR